MVPGFDAAIKRHGIAIPHTSLIEVPLPARTGLLAGLALAAEEPDGAIRAMWAATSGTHRAHFGFVLLGPASPDTRPAMVNTITSQENADISRHLRRFWEIEEQPSGHILSPKDEFCENHFKQTHSRDHTGRYIGRLPLRQEVGNLLDGTRPRAIAFLQKLKGKIRQES